MSHSHLGACYRKKKNKKMTSFQLTDSSDATFSRGVFCFPFLWSQSFCSGVISIQFTFLLPIFWSPSFFQRCQFFTRIFLRLVFGSLHFFLMSSLLLAFLFPIFPIFLDATFSLGVFCFPFFGSHFRCHIFLLPFLLPNFWSQSFF